MKKLITTTTEITNGAPTSDQLKNNSIDSVYGDENTRTVWINGMPYGNAYVKGKDAVDNPEHAEVFNDFSNTASGDYSHAEGKGTQTSNLAEHACGKYNKSGKYTDKNTIFSVGIGTNTNDRKNAMEVLDNGDIYMLGVNNYDGTNIDESQPLSFLTRKGAGKRTEEGGEIFNDYINNSAGDYSHTQGYNNKNIGERSFVGGDSCTNNGNNSFIFGSPLILFREGYQFSYDESLKYVTLIDCKFGSSDAYENPEESITVQDKDRLTLSFHAIPVTEYTPQMDVENQCIKIFNYCTNSFSTIKEGDYVIIAASNDAKNRFTSRPIQIKTLHLTQSNIEDSECDIILDVVKYGGIVNNIKDIFETEYTYEQNIYITGIFKVFSDIPTVSNNTGNINIGVGNTIYKELSNATAIGKGLVLKGVSNTDINSPIFLGQYNDISSIEPRDIVFCIGNGESYTKRSNAMYINNKGDSHIAGNYNNGGADYAEMFEWKDGNTDNEDRVGYFVTLDGEYIRKAKSDDNYILGVSSCTSSFIGDNPIEWYNRYNKDNLGRMMGTMNEDYDPDKLYIRRSDRKEWSTIGLIGKLLVRQDGSLKAGDFCKPNDEGIATKSDTGYYVMKVIDDEVVKILFK